ncbi:hypothetical protein GDO81_009205 [Engystomops pustulosus]|uniref:Indoleamine 2,3-dioxygenase n=1 Tax=Engystomops pustulosus TaxID=76066 RepID=A0AAV7BP73_ENGPU|nr:hypothetical protein GDO81_009205 [Engystomops pustulosus]
MEKIKLEDCYVSEEYGFILQDPLVTLPDYYKPWTDIAGNLVTLIETKKLQDEVRKMPELDIKHLKGHRQLRLARLTLSHIVMGYVWQNGETEGTKVLPRNMAVPLYIYTQVSQILGLPNLSTIVSFPGVDSMQGFVWYTMLVEVGCHPAPVKDNPNMPEGLVYEGVSDEPLSFSGGSAAQSSVYHVLDELLGIKHHPQSADFLFKMRRYMPPAHSDFIRWVIEAPSLSEYVVKSEDPTLLSSFNQCISTLTELRSLHIRIVSKYVNAAGVRARMKKNQTENPGHQERGTAGSQVMTFLKSVRDTSKDGMLRHSTPGDH